MIITKVNFRGRDLPVTQFDTWAECEEMFDAAYLPSGSTTAAMMVLTVSCAPELQDQVDAIAFVNSPACPDNAEAAFKVHEEFDGGDDD